MPRESQYPCPGGNPASTLCARITIPPEKDWGDTVSTAGFSGSTLTSAPLSALVLCLAKSFFSDDSQPVIVAVLPDPVLQAPCPHALVALLPLMNQLSPLVHPCDSLCFRYCHVLLSIVSRVCLFFWIPVFQVLWISIAR